MQSVLNSKNFSFSDENIYDDKIRPIEIDREIDLTALENAALENWRLGDTTTVLRCRGS